LGYLDVRINSPGYLHEHVWLYQPLIAMLVACVVAAAAGIALCWWTPLGSWLARHRRTLGTVALWSVLALAALLASRPLWMVRRGIEPGSNQEWFIAAAQRVAGLPVDGRRSYDEMTLVWLGWYLGPVTLVLAALGAALVARRAVQGRRPELVVLLVALGVPSLLYLLRPSITPDMIWAMRRFLPAVIPAALLGAGWFVHWAAVRARATWARVLTALAAVAVLGAPLATWGSILRTPEYVGRAGEVAALCEQVEGSRVVVVRGRTDPPLLPTLRIVCDVDVIEVRGPASQATLAAVREAWDGQPVRLVTMSGDAVDWPLGTPATLVTPMARWPHAILPTNDPIRFTSRVWVAEVAADGSADPVAPQGAQTAGSAE
ncbi:MAG TPA: hypothetical protein VF143_11785, partial [Candidatus Nanopelagicales bacterium]